MALKRNSPWLLYLELGRSWRDQDPIYKRMLRQIVHAGLCWLYRATISVISES